MTTIKLTGHAAIAYAEDAGFPLAKYADPTEGARTNLTVAQAREIAAEDPGLIYLVLEMEDALDGDQVAVIVLEEDYETPTRLLYAGAYLVRMPPEYDPEIVTGEDIIHDGLIRVIRHAEAVA